MPEKLKALLMPANKGLRLNDLHRKYFGADRGVTYYNFTSNQFTGFHGIVIPGTLREHRLTDLGKA